ncbi:hypothetical protein LTR62_006757 [Meristemomyces frigidus]|uniref:WKF domain-containing protein n=1 Tax=Meristemomyces frigidus TaxID=1508187 RepID=A0AAN7TQE8_9PEZI|nr:hypothetical protein LTR62_006757 [Meristemomyces frigidus]
MSTPAVSSQSQVRVPAWKRIGLKLKYAKDSAETPAPAHSTPTITQGSPSTGTQQSSVASRNGSSHDSSGRSAKRRKASTQGSLEPHLEFGHPTISSVQAEATRREITTGEDLASTYNNKLVATAPLLKSKSSFQTLDSRRKSVTFAADTKVDDGFSAQQLARDWEPSEASDENANQDLIDAWEASEAGKANSRVDSEPVEAAEQAPKPSEKERKKDSKSQKSSSGSAKTSARDLDEAHAGETLEYVRYLEQYHTNRDHWKFNKNKQKDVLRNIFNVKRISPEHNEALFAYISGLQGAAAQQRLLEEAEGVLKELLEKQERGAEVETMDSSQARRRAYLGALERETARIAEIGRSEHDEQMLEELKRGVEQAKRADSILGLLLAKELIPVVAPAPPPPSSAIVAPVSAIPQGHRTVFEDEPEPNSAKHLGTNISKPITKKRKRKARTDVSSDESSSSDSSSESEGE